MFSIEKNVPLPEDLKTTQNRKYPFADMKVKDSFLVPVNRTKTPASQIKHTVDAAARLFRLRYKHTGAWQFVTKVEAKGVRCWRTR